MRALWVLLCGSLSSPQCLPSPSSAAPAPPHRSWVSPGRYRSPKLHRPKRIAVLSPQAHSPGASRPARARALAAQPPLCLLPPACLVGHESLRVTEPKPAARQSQPPTCSSDPCLDPRHLCPAVGRSRCPLCPRLPRSSLCLRFPLNRSPASCHPSPPPAAHAWGPRRGFRPAPATARGGR